MKLEKLKSPFTWNKRHILVQDRVWYVPDGYEDYASFSFPGWEHPLFFNGERPICLEYCSGNGAWIAAKAQAQPEYNWVAVERKFDRVRKIWAKTTKFQLNNLLMICGEGHRVTHHYLPNGSVHSVFINFPDPWPKQRHAKHRIVQVPFIEEVRRILCKGGTLTMVTDDVPHSQWMIKVLQCIPGFESVFPDPFYVTDYPDYGTSFFEDLWRQKGKAIHYHVFRKIG
jgi:tRNA (guanine-N7-)-methyltransferase